MGKKVVTLGEIMLRLSTPGNTRFVQSDSFDVVYGGGEANVAVSCANYGHDAYFVTKLPKHEIGQSAVNALRKYGVKTDFIARGGDRVGIYYLETGASMRPSKVIYDRAHSSIAEADASDFDFGDIFDSIFGGGSGFSGFGFGGGNSTGRSNSNRARRGSDVLMRMDLDFGEAVFGCEKKFNLDVVEDCDECDGKGGFGEEQCSTCHGSGTVTSEQHTILGSFLSKSTCPDCGGTGHTFKRKCTNCKFRGKDNYYNN